MIKAKKFDGTELTGHHIRWQWMNCWLYQDEAETIGTIVDPNTLEEIEDA